MMGTQMVAKGVDLEDVTLVRVLGIDSLLFAQGFRAYENVFSLITQVVGRSGRARDPGLSLIHISLLLPRLLQALLVPLPSRLPCPATFWMSRSRPVHP